MAEKRKGRNKDIIQYLYIIYPDKAEPITTKKKADVVGYFGEKRTASINTWFKHSGCFWRCLHKGIEVRRHIIPKMLAKVTGNGFHLTYKRL